MNIRILILHQIRGKEATCYIKNDIAELPLVLFDRVNIITFREKDKVDINIIKEIFENNKIEVFEVNDELIKIKFDGYLDINYLM